MSSRLIIRFVSKLKSFHYNSPSSSHDKICRAFIISSNQYGSFRPTCLPSPLLYRSDSLFSNSDFTFNNEQMTVTTDYGTTSRRSTDVSPNQQENTNNTSLLEHYLKTYNPLQIDLTNTNERIVKNTSYEEAPSDTDTRPITNCYALNCTSKRKSYHGERYTRLKEQDNCSATMSIADERLSECSTKLTCIGLPVVMITDCSDSQRLHTDIIELNDEEKDK
jgi:hypothetical protein